MADQPYEIKQMTAMERYKEMTKDEGYLLDDPRDVLSHMYSAGYYWGSVPGGDMYYNKIFGPDEAPAEREAWKQGYEDAQADLEWRKELTSE